MGTWNNPIPNNLMMTRGEITHNHWRMRKRRCRGVGGRLNDQIVHNSIKTETPLFDETQYCRHNPMTVPVLFLLLLGIIINLSATVRTFENWTNKDYFRVEPATGLRFLHEFLMLVVDGSGWFIGNDTAWNICFRVRFDQESAQD